MAYSPKTVRNPASEYLFKIQLIVSNTEFKNNELASDYETLETKLAGDAYCRAKLETDIFESYEYSEPQVYDALVRFGIPGDKIYTYIKNPIMIPPAVKKYLMEEARNMLIATYVERNKYYCNLAGKPFAGNATVPADEIVYVPEDFYKIYSDDGIMMQNQAIHELDVDVQNLFMNTVYYEQVKKEHPNATYLNYIGSNAIPYEISRKTRDGDIMKINTDKLHTYHQVFGNVNVTYDMVHMFVNVYGQVRDYVYNTLRGDFTQIYPNYNNFIRFLTIYMAIGQSLNEFMKKSSSMAYMNDATANNFFVLYGLPSVIMEGQSMISFLKKLRMLLMDKGTNIVYRVKDIIGYKYTDIYTLVMVKQQVFENGYPKYTYDETGKAIPVYNIVFRRLGTTDDNTSYFKFRDSNVEYPWEEIASGDPRWWNTPEVEQMLYDMNYTLSNSKYIQLSTHMSMSDVFWQCVIFLRGLLDNRKKTQYSPMSINFDLAGGTEINVFDAVLVLVILMNWNTNLVTGRTLDGHLFSYNGYYNGAPACIDMLFNGLTGFVANDLKPGHPFKIASFNYNIKTENPDFYYSLDNFDYLEPSTFKDMLDHILDNSNNNVGESLMSDVYSLFKYLETKLVQSRTIHEFRQVTDVYNNLFLVDPIRSMWYDSENSDVTKTLMNMYNITYYDLTTLMNFCGRNDIILPVAYNNYTYNINIGIIMNNNAYDYEYKIGEEYVYPFQDNKFVEEFVNSMEKFSSTLISMSNLPNSIKQNYQHIITDKVLLDIGQTSSGPKSFESLLFVHNPDLYRRLMIMKGDGSNLIMLMRAIVKGLETYANSDLHALEFSAIGEDEYMSILKEVISYFKSYMVEFTKEEFVYVMDGLFDNGGNSNMLRLYDEINDLQLNMHVTDSLTLHDVSNSEIFKPIPDNEVGFIHDEAIIRMTSTYGYIRQMGYEVWFDDGNRISKNKPDTVTDDTEMTINLVQDTTNNTYKIIIPLVNIK